MKRGENGFTLIELLVVIAIIGILAVVALPALFKNINKAKIAKLESNYNTIKSSELSYYADHNSFTTLSSLDIEGLDTNKSPIGGEYKILMKDKNNQITSNSKPILAYRVGSNGSIKEKIQLDEFGDIYLAIQGNPKEKIHINNDGFKILIKNFGADNVYIFTNPSGVGYQYNEIYLRIANSMQ